VGRNELEGSEIVSRLVDSGILLGSSESGGRVGSLVVSEVGYLSVSELMRYKVRTEPESHGGHDTERDSESPLSGELGVTDH
jgi:hypothetical protein